MIIVSIVFPKQDVSDMCLKDSGNLDGLSCSRREIIVDFFQSFGTYEVGIIVLKRWSRGRSSGYDMFCHHLVMNDVK